MNILDEIIAKKKEEVREQKLRVSVSELQRQPGFARPCYSLSEQLRAKGASGIIAEFKRRSPSKGVINGRADINDVVMGYQRSGASGVSILTDESFFGGSLADVTNTRERLTLPVLRKDFIIDEYQIIESKAAGADVILLIAACLTRGEVAALSKMATNLGLEVLLELHAESELAHVSDNISMIGINNRDLKSFRVTPEHSLAMAEKIPGDKIKIAESGINSAADVFAFRRGGFSGFLIGEQFMKHADPAIAFADFVQALSQPDEAA